CHQRCFRRVIGRFAFAQLRGAYLTGVPLPFPATLKTPALYGRPLQWFETPPSQSWSQRARERTFRSFLHLSYSIALLVTTLLRHLPPPHSRHTRAIINVEWPDDLSNQLHRIRQKA